MTLLNKILLGGAVGLSLFVLLTTPEERFKLIAPPTPKPPEPVRPPRPIPVPEKASFANLPLGSIVLLKAGPGLPNESDIPRGEVAVIKKELPPPIEAGPIKVPVPWRYTGRPSNANLLTRDVRFEERDIERLVSVPPSPI